MNVVMRVREKPSSAWIQNLSNYGWKVRGSDGTWIQMTPQNTKVRSADGATWLDTK